MAKTESFEEYMEGWSKTKKKREKKSSTNLSDPSGGVDGVIKSTGTIQSKMGKREEQTTRIRRTKEPRTGVINFKSARRRRKNALIEI